MTKALTDNVLKRGRTIGFLGGGQLARMAAVEARRLGYRTAVLDPNAEGPGAEVSDDVEVGAWNDLQAALRLAQRCDVLTLDTEHIPAINLKKLEAICPVHPGFETLSVVQDRRFQREFLQQLGLPQPEYRVIDSDEDVEHAKQELGCPCILKSRTCGYDGKGQTRVEDATSGRAARRAINDVSAVLEAFVHFECELSVVLARDFQGNVESYPIIKTVQKNHALRLALLPAGVSAAIEEQALRIARRIAEALNYVGVIAVEMFLTKDGTLLINELAPRTHNSGHTTLGSSATSQFEQHVRAIAGLPLGASSVYRPCVLVNLFGDLWQSGEPDWSVIDGCSRAKLHLYGKRAAKPGRKMGHVLLFAPSAADNSAETLRELEAEGEALLATLEARSIGPR